MCNETELLYRIALNSVSHIGAVHARLLLTHIGSAENIFKMSAAKLEKLEGIGTIRANAIRQFVDFNRCEKEIEFIKKNKITPLLLFDDNYPTKLLHCYDAPTVLFYKGNAKLNENKMVAIVGTRNNTAYGKQLTEETILFLQQFNVSIISGLAFGIDTHAHTCCIKNNINTIGVLAHGLNRIYPSQNKQLASQMIQQGGLLTEYMSNANPDRENFPKRNRIIAGLCDCLIVIESGIKGGSIITAEIANSYHKDVFAYPGKTIDAKSEGCNYLISKNKAALLASPQQIAYYMNWMEPVKRKPPTLFPELNNHEKLILEILSNNAQLHIDELYLKSKFPLSALAAALLSLEMHRLIISLPGKMYKLNN